jgi:hypothetical protein
VPKRPPSRTNEGRSTSKPVAPRGTDRALTIGAGPGSLKLSYWDLWFALVAQRWHEGDLDRLAAGLRQKRETSFFGRESATAKLSHLRDLQKRLRAADVGVEQVVEAASDLVTAGEVRRARGRVLEGKERQSEWSEQMHETPAKRGWAFALRGYWPRFPVSPEPFADEILSHFNLRRLYSAEQSFGLSRKLGRYVERAERLLKSSQYAEAQALLRGWITATIEVIESADDSYGTIGDEFHTGFEQYLKIASEQAGMDEADFFQDLLMLLIWEDYGLTCQAMDGYFRKLSKVQGELCIEFLRTQIEELRAEDLEYQSEKALTYLGQVAAEQERFELFEDLARQMGSRAWERIIRLADRAMKRRKRDLAKRVFELALTPGFHHDFLSDKYEQLKRGRWNPDPRK